MTHVHATTGPLSRPSKQVIVVVRVTNSDPHVPELGLSEAIFSVASMSRSTPPAYRSH